MERSTLLRQGDHYEVHAFNHQDSGAAERKSNYLITMPCGIGDTVYVGLAAVDQVIKSKPQEAGRIDVLCNATQSEIFSHDPRINLTIIADKTVFPNEDSSTWRQKALSFPEHGHELLQVFQENDYEGVFPGNEAFGFWRKLNTHVMYPRLFDVVKDCMLLRRQQDAPATTRVRKIIARALNDSREITQATHEIPLFISREAIEEAQAMTESIKNEGERLLLVAPDTASKVTRPPTQLLSEGIRHALEHDQKMQVLILPSYSEQGASIKLADELAMTFRNRIWLISADPKPGLLSVTALIDQAEVFVTGDTGVMHLAAAVKELPVSSSGSDLSPRNLVKIIALFGGTSPGLYGYRDRTEVLGRGRKEQRQITPGLSKRRFGYNPEGKEFFDHISPHVLGGTIIRAVWG